MNGVWLVLLAGVGRADLTASALVDAVQANFDAIQTLSCSVTITSSVAWTRTTVARTTTVSAYRYWLKRPDKLRVETPDGNALLRDGARSWRFSPGGGSVELPPTAAAAPVALPPAMLWNFRDALGGLALKLNGVVDGGQVLEAWPAPSAGSGQGPAASSGQGPAASSGQAAHHEFDIGAGGAVRRIRLFDPSGAAYHVTTVTSEMIGGASVPAVVVETFQSPANVTTMRYEFADLRLNEELPDSLFQP